MATATGQAPNKKTHRVVMPAIAAGSDGGVLAFVAPFACTVSSVKFTPAAAITGATTNNRTHTVYNRGQAGAGTVKIAELIYDNAINAASKTPKTITLSVTATNLDLAAGDVVEVISLHNGTGIADPGGLFEIVTARN
jgi:hypothetical protein